MIFLTVGTQLPFDRLVGAVDRWAEANPGVEVFGQIGPSDLKPKAMRWSRFLDPGEYADAIARSHCLVAHAGIGTFLTSARRGLPLIVMPRRASLGEHRNEHQRATAAWWRARGGVHIADGEADLPGLLDRHDALAPTPPLGDAAEPSMIEAVRGFIEG